MTDAPGMAIIATVAIAIISTASVIIRPWKVPETVWAVSGAALLTVFGLLPMSDASAHEWSAKGVPDSVLLIKPFAVAQVVTAISQLVNAAAAFPAIHSAKQKRRSTSFQQVGATLLPICQFYMED